VIAADLDALDRGVIEAGQLAAQALSRIAALEAEVAVLRELFKRACSAEEIIRRAGLPPEPRTRPPRPRHLKTVR